MSEFKMPTEKVELPSKGKLYPEDSPLSEGYIEMRYMTARDEDTLTNQSYISNGTVLDKLLKDLIVTPINYSDLLVGDKNAIMVAARILGYGKEYKFNKDGEEIIADLSLINNKPLHPLVESAKENSFSFTLPHSGNNITFKLLTHKDEMDISAELEGLKKVSKTLSPDLSTRLKYLITSVEGKTEKKDIRDFVDNYLLAKDSRALREYIKELQPDIDMSIPSDEGGRINISIGVSFFWPDI
jgi:hypothetical protein